MNNVCQYNIFVHSSKRSRGVAILVKKTIDFVIQNSFRDDDENLLILDTHINKNHLTLASVYAPCDNSDVFFSTLKNKVEFFGAPFIIGGDMNTVLSNLPNELNPDLSLHPSSCNTKGTHFLNTWMETGGIIDPFRHLYTTKRDFSFVKNIRGTISKSRIDFFLVSPAFHDKISNADYELTPSSMFDHRLCTFTFKNSVKRAKKPVITNEAIKSPEMLRQAKLAALNVLNLYRSTELTPEFYHKLSELNNMNSQIICLNKYLEKNYDQLLISLRDRTTDEFDASIDEINVSDLVIQSSFSIPYTELLLMLVNEIKLIGNNLSANIKKNRKGHIDNLKYRISSLKKSNCPQATINSMEEELQSLINVEFNVLYRKRTLKNMFFSQNDCATMSSSIKVINSTPLTVLRDNYNNPFHSEDGRNKHILNFYKNIYENVPSRTENINSFLNNESVTQCVNDTASAILCSQISDFEITSIINSLGNTSTGIDGVPNLLIKTLSVVLLPFLTRAFNCVLSNTEQFPKDSKITYIRLIPKKNDLSKLSNWRPISIGNCIFKVYSKVLAARLMQVLPDLCGPSQKAYLKTHNISEASLNCLETICAALKEKISMFVVAIDFRKAFDCLLHEHIFDTLNYFKFPPLFITAIANWLSERRSCISHETGLTDFFKILTGVPQGDPLSGLIFILAIEILLIKLNSCTNLKLDLNLSNNIPIHEIEGYADDLLTFIPTTNAALSDLKQILTDFTKLSGLELNCDKTEVMLISPDDTQVYVDMVSEVGFRNVDSITHLGITFDNKLLKLQMNWSNKIEKIKKLRNFFLTLNLPLAAKVNVIKTFFLSQVCYIAPVIKPDTAFIIELRNIILRFLSPNRNIFPANRVFLARENCGLGIPDPDKFIENLTLKFAFRSSASSQPWSKQLKSFFPLNNPCLSSLPNTAKPTSPSNCQRYIILLDEFHRNFFRGDRFFSTNIFHSGTMVCPTSNRLGIKPPASFRGTGLEKIKLVDCLDFINKKVLPYGQILLKLRTQINYNEYFFIYSIVRKNVNVNLLPTVRPKIVSLEFFFKKNPATKTINKLGASNNADISSFSSIKFFDIYYKSEFNLIQSKNFLSIWTLSCLPTDIKNFVLLRANNKIILNYQLSRFNNAGTHCSFCIFFPTTFISLETPEHLFFDCPITKVLVDKYFDNFIEGQSFCWKECFFKGVKATDVKMRTYVNIEITLFTHYLFSVRSLKKLPSFAGLIYHIALIKKVMFHASKKYADIIKYMSTEKHGGFVSHLLYLDKLPL